MICAQLQIIRYIETANNVPVAPICQLKVRARFNGQQLTTSSTSNASANVAWNQHLKFNISQHDIHRLKSEVRKIRVELIAVRRTKDVLSNQPSVNQLRSKKTQPYTEEIWGFVNLDLRAAPPLPGATKVCFATFPILPILRHS